MTVDRESGQIERIKHGDSAFGPPDHVSRFSTIVLAARVSRDYPLRVISLVMLFNLVTVAKVVIGVLAPYRAMPALLIDGLGDDGC